MSPARELMLHVERIVRPIRALASRKLRMRRELLAHLQAAFEEQRQQGADEQAALLQAKERLGSGDDLRQELQKSVPFLEHRLLAKLPLPGPLMRAEAAAIRFWRMRPMTMLQDALITAGAAILPLTALTLSLLGLDITSALLRVTGHYLLGLGLGLIALAVTLLPILLSTHFIAAVAGKKGTHPLRAVLTLGPLIAALPVISMLLIYWWISASPTSTDVARAIAAGIVVPIGLFIVGRLVAKIGQEHEEWLTLEIA